MRTLVISDLHLGALRRTDVLRRPGPREALCAELGAVDRLVLLGDALELRHGPVRDALTVATPVLAALSESLGPDGEIVLVTGNHDHQLIAPWIDKRGLDGPPAPLGLERAVTVRDSPLLGRLARGLPSQGARMTVRFPGVWLRDDVYALHGHYLDRLITLPSFERLALGVMSRVVGPLPDGAGAASPEDFEAALQPLYAWMHAVAQSPAGSWSAGRQSASANAWKALSGEAGAESGRRGRAGRRRRRIQTATMRAAFPPAVGALNRIGMGPLNADISGHELRRAGLRAIGEVVRRLGVDAEHVVFGHTHRAGPLERDDRMEWTVAGGSGPRLHNCGCWVDEPVFATGGPTSPYWGGRAIELDDDGPPRLVRITEDLGTPGDV